MFGRKRKTYPPPERYTVGEIKKKAFCTRLLMFELRLKKDENVRNVPFSCKLYLYLFALFSLLYFVCTQRITTNVILKIRIIKLWSVYDG